MNKLFSRVVTIVAGVTFCISMGLAGNALAVPSQSQSPVKAVQGELNSTDDAGTLSYRSDHTGSGGDLHVIFESPCNDGGFSAWMSDEGSLLVGCSDGTVVQYELHTDRVKGDDTRESPTAQLRPVGTRRFNGPVGSFFRADGIVWVKTVRTEAVPLSHDGWRTGVGESSGAYADGGITMGDALAAVAEPVETQTSGDGATSTQEAEEVASHVGRVIEIRTGEVVIDIGRNHGLTPKERVEIFKQSEEDLGQGNIAVYTATLAVASVKVVTDERAVVKLGLNEQVPIDAMVRRSTLPLTAKPFAPGKPEGITSVQLTLRPFLPMSSKGFGTMADVAMSYRSAGDWALHLQMEPLGFGLANKGNIISLAANVIAAYDTRLFEIGLGVGWAAITGEPPADDWNPAADPNAESYPTGLSLVQSARLGALDGANISVKNLFLMYQDKFNFGGTFGSIQYPLLFLGDSNWAVLRFGAAATGFVELGLRHLLKGNGGHGSMFLTPTVGGTWLTGYVQSAEICDEYYWSSEDPYAPDDGTGTERPSVCTKSITYAGPMVGLSLEWRI